MEISTTQLIAFTYAAVGVMLIVALYHTILILVDLRKIVRKAVNVSDHLETTVIQPLSWLEHGMHFVTAFLEQRRESQEDDEDEEKPHHHGKHHAHHEKHHEKHAHHAEKTEE